MKMLARVARWNGQTAGANIFSVAQHTLLVEEIARRRFGEPDRRLALALMLHDAPEYVIGDMITPFKAVIGDAYKAVEEAPARRDPPALRPRAPELPPDVLKLVKTADRGAAFLEATQLAGFSISEARRFFGARPVLPAAVERDHMTPWTATVAERRYLDRFGRITDS